MPDTNSQAASGNQADSQAPNPLFDVNTLKPIQGASQTAPPAAPTAGFTERALQGAGLPTEVPKPPQSFKQLMIASAAPAIELYHKAAAPVVALQGMLDAHKKVDAQAFAGHLGNFLDAFIPGSADANVMSQQTVQDVNEGNLPAVAGTVTGLAGRAIASNAPEIFSGAARTIGKTLEKLAPGSMNSLLRANKAANYLYGKNPGRAFIDEQIKIPKDSVTLGGQLENLHGQLEIAQDNLSSQLKTALSEPSVAAQRIDIVPTVTDAVADAKKFISKQTGLDVPKYTQELTKLEDSILTRYDSEGDPTGKITGTKLSPAEVADVKRSLGRNTQWRVLPTDPEIKLKTYLNGVRQRIYGQLADTVEQAAPGADVHELNQRLANSLEAQGLLEKRIDYEHGTGGYNAMARKAELFGGLLTAIVSPEPLSKSLGALAVADRVVRSVPGKMATAKVLNRAGESMQSGVGQTAAKAAGMAALGTVAAQLPNPDENEGGPISENKDPDWIQELQDQGKQPTQARLSDGRQVHVHPADLEELQRRDPGAKVSAFS